MEEIKVKTIIDSLNKACHSWCFSSNTVKPNVHTSKKKNIPAEWLSWSVVCVSKQAAGLIPGQGTYGRQPIDVSVCLSLSPPASLKLKVTPKESEWTADPLQEEGAAWKGQEVGRHGMHREIQSSTTNPGGGSHSLVPTSKRLSNSAQGHKATNK